MDRQLASHTEIKAADHRQAIETLKRRRILEGLAKLQASNPAVAMVSNLALQEEEHLEDPTLAAAEEAAGEQERACDNPSCKEERENQVDMLSEALRKVTCR